MSGSIENDAALQQVLAALEVVRKKIARQRITDEILLGIAFVGLSVGYFVSHLMIGILIFIIFVILFSVRRAFRMDMMAAYRERYKREVIGTALKFIDPSLTFDPYSGISLAEFEYCQLFDKMVDRYGTEDLVLGTAGNTGFYFAEVLAEQQRQKTANTSNTKSEWIEVFKGMIFVADFNKNFNKVTIVKPKAGRSAMGAWLSKNVSFFADENLVSLENPDFDKTFVTYCSDQVEARYILTPSLMERIIKLNQQTEKTISLSFVGSRMYIAFPKQRNYFEAPIYESLLKPFTLYTDINVIKFMYDIVKELDLNTRIWGKA